MMPMKWKKKMKKFTKDQFKFVLIIELVPDRDYASLLQYTQKSMY